MKIYIGDIDIESILFSGACFRTIKENDGSITDILNDRVINIKRDGEYIYVTSSNNDNLEEIIKDYFDLNRDYNKIDKEIIKKDSNLKNMIDKCKNYRILNQDPFEMGISYIISQNNNVKRISKSINELCKNYGKKVVFNNNDYYLFPKYESIKNISIEELRNYGVGFRDKYIKDYLDNYEYLNNINELSTEEALVKLMNIKGIGLKVASCILLFGYKRLDVFPIDTWVKHFMKENFNIKEDQKEIEKYARDNFGKYSGLVIQYMFHYNRNL
ncbi:MAG: 8-oxoguanine DNA glycosylase [Bacilli bacterium]|nr:8-oxoguanine DNA glycosylase [Bacilli bacterium]